MKGPASCGQNRFPILPWKCYTISMYLKSLELTGFKSFAKKSQLDFGTSIASIVGPNGSGKSNVAEAFRFVLGEQSIKSLRGKKGEDLIFNGSKEAGRANRASVKVTFDNSRRLLDVDFDEVSIERVVHRDGVNEYFINGSQVRLKDIIEMLAKAHIGSSGHHIISQGEADRILNATIRERRAMIEDALGLKIYQWKRQESEKKLEKTGENIEKVESLRREIAPHLKFLKKQVEKVEKALEMKRELEQLYLEYFRREDEHIRAEKKRLALARQAPEETLKRLDTELAEAKRVLEHSATKDAKSEELIALEGKLAAVRAERDEVSRAMGRLEGMIAAEEGRAQRLRAAASQAETKTVRLLEVDAMSKEVDAEIRIAETSEDVSAIRASLSRIRDLILGFVSKNKTQVDESGIAESAKEIARMQAERAESDARVREIGAREDGLRAEYRALQNAIEKEKDSSRDAEKALFRIVAEQNEVRGRLNALKVEDDRLAFEDDAFKREIQEAHHLVGRAVLEFHAFAPQSAEGVPLAPEELASEPRGEQEERRKRIEKIKIRLEDAGGAGGDDVLKEFREVSERDVFLEKELVDLRASAESLTKLIKELEEKLDIEFKNGVAKINAQFQTFFALMFGGGEAKLQIVKEPKRRKAASDDDMGELASDESALAALSGEAAGEDEEEQPEGIDIFVNLPRKKIKGLQMLSGGERALTSIALLFAVSQVNPPPFIILDETDAALDEANSRKYGEMIETLSKYSQLILITHNRETMSRAGLLYGVTMGADGASRLLSIAFEEAVKVAK